MRKRFQNKKKISPELYFFALPFLFNATMNLQRISKQIYTKASNDHESLEAF